MSETALAVTEDHDYILPAGDTSKVSDDDASMYAQILESGTSADEFYVAMRRLLLHRKALGGNLKRQSWQRNGVSYLGYRDYLRHVKEADPSPPARKKKDRTRARANLIPHQPLAMEKAVSDSAAAAPAPLPSPFPPPKVKVEQDKPLAEMYCSFQDCNVSVTVVKFARRSTNQLAYALSNGMLRICTAAQPAVLLHDLRGHTKAVTDFEWSSDNDYLCSSSKDKSIRVWDAPSGTCIRIVYGTLPVHGICFHPANNNLLLAAIQEEESTWLVGGAPSGVHVINFSTGKVVYKVPMEQRVTCMEVDPAGRVLFAADAMGTVHSLEMDALKGTVLPRHKSSAAGLRPTPATSLHLKPFSHLANGPLLLAYTRDGSLRLFTVALEISGYLLLLMSFQLSPRARASRTCFAPYLCFKSGEIVVTGSDDFRVYFYDFSRATKPLVAKLQGHKAPVVDVCWNYGGSMLASGDADGQVIVWKKDESV